MTTSDGRARHHRGRCGRQARDRSAAILAAKCEWGQPATTPRWAAKRRQPSLFVIKHLFKTWSAALDAAHSANEDAP